MPVSSLNSMRSGNMAKQDQGGKDDLIPNYRPGKREAQDRAKGRMAESPVDDVHVDAPKQTHDARTHRSDADHERRELVEGKPPRTPRKE